jgi:ParB-like chromosome segregation protein Spo0J
MAPLASLQWVDRDKLQANSWNPNKVSKENLELLTRSIEVNGWTMPIAVRPDFTIIDGFHRWMVAGQEPLCTKLEGKVPIVIVKHDDEAEDMYGTVTHNRARGVHLLEPMKNIVKKLLSQGKTVKEIGKELGMKPEEVFRLSDLSKEHFLKLMAERSQGYSKEVLLRKM